MVGKVIHWFKQLSGRGKTALVIATAITTLFIAGASADPPVITTKIETQPQTIAFSTTEQEDETLLVGQTKVITPGVSGEKEVEYKVTYTGDTETAREVTSKPAVTKKEPITQVVAKGVKEVATVTTTEAIPFASTTSYDSAADKGTSRVSTQGINGSKRITYEVVKIRGQEVSRTVTKEEVTAQPVTQVTTVGTKAPYVAPQASCTNGSYINSAGNRVCSPGSSSAGATAKCRDGTYSYSQSRRGTCSRHGGVAQWL